MTSMKKNILPKLDLELLQPDGARWLGGRQILAAGILLAFAMAVYVIQTTRKISAIEAGMARTIYTPQHQVTPANDEEIIAVQESLDRLSLPWGALFTALEGVAAEEINLISIEPDVQTYSVEIIAEGPDIYEVLEYVRSLSKQPKLKDVFLTQYEIRLDTAKQPIRFNLVASWR